MASLRHHCNDAPHPGYGLKFNSAIAAVRAAISFQNLVRDLTTNDPEDMRIRFRVGINVGDVIVEPQDIFGDEVNIAARLEGIAEPGGICISSTVHAHVSGKVEADFVDIGDQELKNIDRPVRAFAISQGSEPKRALQKQADKFSPPRLSIVVLPFENLSRSPEQDYFVDGVTESLTTDLSRISDTFVIGRHTAFTFKGKTVDLRQIARELDVRYVLEASVQRSGPRLRVNVQLVDGENANHLWADRFDTPIADLFDMQDEIVTRLAFVLGTQLVVAEAARTERSANPDAVDLTFQGRAWLYKGTNAEHLTKARTLFERALAFDERNVGALVAMGHLDLMIGATLMTVNRAAHFEAAERRLLKALTFDPNHANAHLNLAGVYIFTNRAIEGVSGCHHALTLDRNNAAAYAALAVAKFFLGRSADCEGHVREALRLSPRDLRAHQWLHFVGAAKFQLGACEEAIIWLRKGIDGNPNFPPAYFSLAASLAHVGKVDEAKIAAAKGLALNPSYTIQNLHAIKSSDNPIYLEGRDRLTDGLRLAGIPEK